METDPIEHLRFPIGKFTLNANPGQKDIKQWIADIEQLPALLRKAVLGLSEKQLSTPYRDGGWTVRQTVHHLADSHINAYIRIKFALTEDHPTIKPYNEEKWAEMDDAKNLPVEVSLSLLKALHVRWVHMLKKMSPADYEKTVFHPVSKREMSVKFLMNLYSWHSRHHTAHITSLRRRKKW
jgi:hypothetical protein